MPFSFQDAIAKISSTPLGQEAAMYGPIRDLFIQILGYPASNVDIDITGEDGRPDVTVKAPTGLLSPAGGPALASWIVVEAKDEAGCFLHADSREAIFAEKSKYIGPFTSWFVMVDPLCFVIRPVTGLVHSGEADILIEFLSISEAHFREKCQPLEYNLAGVSAQLESFRKGDKKTIAVDKLSSASETPSKRDLNRIRLNRKRFFQQIREATQHLQESVLMTRIASCRISNSTELRRKVFGGSLGSRLIQMASIGMPFPFEVGRKGR